MYKEWLVEQVTDIDILCELADIKEEWNVTIEQFETTLDKLNQFMGKFLQGDQLWRFDSGRSSFVSLRGRYGYCIVRGDEIIENFTIWVS